ncbi:DUF4373 domain-containing protein [Bacteroides heparinolyticus]|uniref:DUF4373 domain-containing protein n=1 Tax=Prevotella heparinolytica TaxID=28113 RepID=UPI0035A0A7AB
MKETFYFQHDYNARNDPKMQRLIMKCGCEGIGIYWCIIEQLYEQGGKLPNNHIETIAFNLHTTKTTVEEVVFGLNLFVFDDEFFWSESVLKRLENRSLISSKRSEAGKKGGAPIGNKNAAKNHKNSNIESESDESNKQMLESETSKNKQKVEKNKQKQTIKEKEKKENNNISTSNEVEYIGAKRTAFVPPTIEEVKAYIQEKGYPVDAERFIDFYTSKGWMVGKNKMKDWKAAVRTWSKGNNTVHSPRPQGTNSANSINDEWL